MRFWRDARVLDDRANDEDAAAKEKRWHGDVSMSDQEWARQRALGKASEDRMKATADRHAAMAGTRRSSGLAETIGGGTANSPFGMSPEEREFAKWNPGTAEAAMHSRATMQEGEKNRSLQRDIESGRNRREDARDSREMHDREMQLKYGHLGALYKQRSDGDASVIPQIRDLENQAQRHVAEQARERQRGGTACRGRAAAPVTVDVPPPVDDKAVRSALRQVATQPQALSNPQERAKVVERLRLQGLTGDRLTQYVRNNPPGVGLGEAIHGHSADAAERGQLTELIRSLVAGTPQEGVLAEVLKSAPDYGGYQTIPAKKWWNLMFGM